MSLDKKSSVNRKTNETEITSNDDNVFKWIEHNKEWVQLLHHCIVLQRSACAFAVGNESGRILYSCILTVDEDLTYAYKSILDAIYEDVMECFFRLTVSWNIFFCFSDSRSTSMCVCRYNWNIQGAYWKREGSLL